VKKIILKRLTMTKKNMLKILNDMFIINDVSLKRQKEILNHYGFSSKYAIKNRSLKEYV
jgi:hypothetical protein